MKPRTYIETTILSYLTARGTRDLVRAAEQEMTREWWDGRHTFDLFISQLVLSEAAAGDTDAAARRLLALQEATILETTEEAIELGRYLITAGGLPSKASADALHIAIATVHGLDYLVSWNCTHIANARTRGKIEALCRQAGYNPAMLCTPMELMEE
ncbi:MAG: type II toxin-antitoxin system VapC family toxin [Nitrosomonas sp.]|nr:type II toxin-antitoxin system VapC family toxin [Nitrosomonas sp.]